jgi:hypothetical protein
MDNMIHEMQHEVKFSGRPVRDTTIQADEIINLVILLNTTYDVNEFLGKI